jgi:GMP synthase-like glutamine amidotransferase
MKLAILETGAPPDGVREQFGDYPSMFRRLLGEGAHDYATFDVAAGELPKAVTDYPAYLVTGSSAGVYDPLPWIAPLKDFLVSAKGRAALVGVCFGHQVMAEAFGGKAVKSPKGWGLGLHQYEVRQGRDWMDAGPAIAAAASHQDQVVDLPPGATVIAANGFTPYGMLAYGDQPAISIQLHPEFDPPFAQALIAARRGTRVAEAEADAAIASLEAPNDRLRIGGWIERFLREATISAD